MYTRPDLSVVDEKLLARADRGDAEAMCEIGDVFYQAKKGEGQDWREAFVWYERAAKAGSRNAQGNVAYFLSDGVLDDVPNEVAAHPWFLRAASQGETYSWNSLLKRQQAKRFDADTLLATVRRQADALRGHLVAIKRGDLAADLGAQAGVCWRMLTWPVNLANEHNCPLGSSRLGGVPDMVKGIKWPRQGGEPLLFLAQINLSEVPTAAQIPALAAACEKLPKNGLIWLFAERGTGGELTGDARAVISHGPLGPGDKLQRFRKPKGLQAELSPLQVIFEPELTLPTPIPWDADASLGAKFPIHRLLNPHTEGTQDGELPVLSLSLASNTLAWGEGRTLHAWWNGEGWRVS